jgi:hypothetical protein
MGVVVVTMTVVVRVTVVGISVVASEDSCVVRAVVASVDVIDAVVDEFAESAAVDVEATVVIDVVGIRLQA